MWFSPGWAFDNYRWKLKKKKKNLKWIITVWLPMTQLYFFHISPSCPLEKSKKNGSSNHLMFFHRIWIWFPKANTHLNRQSCHLDSPHTWQPRDPHTQTTGKTFGDKENPGFLIIQMEPQKCQDHTVNQNYLQADTADICIERIEWWEM